jgi:hypothetical protein
MHKHVFKGVRRKGGEHLIGRNENCLNDLPVPRLIQQFKPRLGVPLLPLTVSELTHFFVCSSDSVDVLDVTENELAVWVVRARARVFVPSTLRFICERVELRP